MQYENSEINGNKLTNRPRSAAIRIFFFWHLNLGSLSSCITMPREERKLRRQKQPVQGYSQSRKRVPRSSTRPIEKTKRENLTLSDWMTVYAYVDTLPQPINQGAVVKHFATRPERALLFTQPTLSRKLQQRSEMEARLDSNPNALSSKRPRAVTKPNAWVCSRPCTLPDECRDLKVEEELLELVAELKARGHITGELPTLDELLDPDAERVYDECLYSSEDGDLEIVRRVQEEMGLARGDIEEIESDSDSDSDSSGPEVVPPSIKEMLEACRMLEEYSMVVCTEGSYELVQAARRYRGHLIRMRREGAKQTTLDKFLNLKST